VQSEQKRAAQSKRAHRKENDRNIIEKMKDSGSRTAGKKQGRVNEIKEHVALALQDARVPEVITSKFNFTAADLASAKSVVSITDGSCGYGAPLISHISLQIGATERVAIFGDNGSGKSTLIKAILRDPAVRISGDWVMPKREDIGYLDQHYATLRLERSVFEVIQEQMPRWTMQEIRKHLNDFLFRKNEEVMAQVKTLSGGEKVRLSLAVIAAQSPKLLVLDEVTNNLDLETREHVVQVLAQYPGAMVIISHDLDFLQRIGVETSYEVIDRQLVFIR
jgi:ATPase subunit of ABC transporter with duplicated ATPase domains